MESLAKEPRSGPARSRVHRVLIGTKLHVPPLKARMLDRNRIVDRLSESKDRRLFVVSGAAGCGKTSLVCQWIARDRLRAAWYSLDTTDNEPDTFFRYLITALSGLDSKVASAMKPLLALQRGLSEEDVIPLVLQSLARIDADNYLVLDDYHVIESAEIHRAVKHLLDYIPETTHVVIVSRHAVPFSVAAFAVRNQLVELSDKDLQFTDAETELFFQHAIPVKLSGEQIRELRSYTEGWVTALQLFGISVSGKKTPFELDEMLKKVRRESTEYLMDEVISVQPEHIREFLCATSFLDRFNAELCEEITGLSDIPAIFDHLYRTNLFLIPLDSEHTWFRYHHLFSKAIRERAGRSSPGVASRTQKKAAAWFARKGYLEEALQYAFAAGDFERAADVMEDYWLYDGRDFGFYLRWFGRLPRQTIAERPLLRLNACTMRMESHRLIDVENVIEDIESRETEAFKRYDGNKRRLCRDLLTYYKSTLPYYRDLAGSNLTMVLLEDRLVSGMMKLAIARFEFFRGNLSSASHALAEARKTIFSYENAWFRMVWSKFAADVERWQGHLHRAGAILDEAFLFLDQKGLSDVGLKPALYLPMGWVHYCRNDLGKALEYATVAVRYLEQTGAISFVLEGYLLLSSVHLAAGQPEKAEQCVHEMRRASRATGNQNLVVVMEACTAYPYIGEGDLTRLERWVRSRESLPEQPFSFHLVLDYLARAGLLLRQERYPEGLRKLEALRETCVSRDMIMPVMDIDLMRAAALYGLGRPEDADTLLSQTMELCENEGYIRMVLNYVPILGKMTRAFSQDSRISEFFGSPDFGAYRKRNSSTPVSGKAHCGEELTQREIAMLRLIAAGFQNKEIAARECVSLNTVKTHNRHIFDKLDVRTRVQAIRRAQDLRLLGNS